MDARRRRAKTRCGGVSEADRAEAGKAGRSRWKPMGPLAAVADDMPCLNGGYRWSKSNATRCKSPARTSRSMRSGGPVTPSNADHAGKDVNRRVWN